ncbi:hypothetical protein METBIDRAFT_166152 [Metschnikowia bicuspidata var. bicuspidata NRRL YB-4993]|uniref:Telomere length regulation protein conserved domain-containing protein n=1 Tax=Metschnikowia bicuspidata var. bicuspidata NRRL YB-4993 TaxID=869754 RepID=A0A1A0HA50_9ASCO|nr:hypothetical protein METBIDRAFT_166152 [Metschnikowia bicuspidata var. bicuspidata NRRL YB-4993]OBA20891.1 hypothetical protein METBIDRAFT_166152 [Metschnikowia bicuspidata var. bicuspidata NRRL YB-4993]
MDILKGSPLPAQIQECIRSVDLSRDVDLLRLVSTLLKYTVPQTYLSLPGPCQDAVSRVFRTVVGLGNLTARIGMFSRQKTDLPRDVCKALDAHMQLLHKALAPGLVGELVFSASLAARREIEKLLFKGKTYAIVREAALNYSDMHVPPMLQNMDAYTGFLATELLLLEDAASFSVALLSFGNSAAFFDVLFSRAHADFLRQTVGTMKRFERKQVLVKFLDFAFSRYLGSGASSEAVVAVSVLSREIIDNSVWDELLLEKVVSRYSYPLNSMVALLVDSAPSLVPKFLATWGAAAGLVNEPIVKQGYRTHLLLCLCAQLPPGELQDLLKLPAFVSAITNRLSSLSSQVKFLGVLFADKLSSMAQAQPIFDMNNMRDMQQPDFPADFLKSADFSLSVTGSWEVLESPYIVETGDLNSEAGIDLKPLTLQETPKKSFAADLNMSDEEDDPTLASREKVPVPIYVRDLLSYLSVDSKDQSAYEKQKIALEITPTLLRQKLAFGSEVSFYANDLLAQLVGLSNQYDDNNFETSRLNAMIAVVVSYPDVSLHLCKLLLTGDYSLQQRLSLLSAMSFGARALRGYKDEIVDNSFKPTPFPSKTLPKKLHDQYTAMDYGYSRIENSIQNALMRESSEEARDELSGGRVLRVSAKLRKEPKTLEVSKDQLPNFRDIVGRLFFFPLVAVWYESGGINIGHYTPVLIAHYVRTLSLILHCAYPTAIDLKDMAGEYLTLVTPVLQKVGTDQLQVIESIVTGVTLICEILDPTFLITSFDGNLHIIESVLLQWWESLIDDRVKSLCAGLLLRLNRLRENMERTLLDQMNGALFA